MKNKPVKVLLIEDNPGDARLIQELLSETNRTSFDAEVVQKLSCGLDELSTGKFDAAFAAGGK